MFRVGFARENAGDCDFSRVSTRGRGVYPRAVTEPNHVRVGVLGCGIVGSALVTLVAERADAIEARTGLRLDVARVAVRNLSRERGIALPAGGLTRDAQSVVDD